MEEVHSKIDLVQDGVLMLRFMIDAIKEKETVDGGVIMLGSIASQIGMAATLLRQHMNRLEHENKASKEAYSALLKRYEGLAFELEAKERGYVKYPQMAEE